MAGNFMRDGGFRTLSPFVIVIEKGNDLVLFHTLTQSVAVVPQNKYRHACNSEYPARGCEPSLRQDGAALTDFIGTPDDIPSAKRQWLRQRADSDTRMTAHLTLVPTLECNKNCAYCYHGRTKHSGRIESRLFAGILRVLDCMESFDDCIAITLHGGEPLLALTELEQLFVFFSEYGLTKRRCIETSLLTNGRRLRENDIESYKRCLIKNVSVTIDRYDVCAPTWHRQKEHLVRITRSLCAEGIGTRIVFNVDSASAHLFNGVVEDLSALQGVKGATVGIGYVESKGKYRTGATAMGYLQFVEFYWAKQRLLRSLGWGRSCSLPVLRPRFCLTDRSNSICIGPRGLLYKCNVDVSAPGAEYARIENGQPVLSAPHRIVAYEEYDVFDDQFCADCPAMLVCNGDCPRKRLRGERNSSYCKGIRRNIALQVLDYLDGQRDS